MEDKYLAELAVEDIHKADLAEAIFDMYADNTDIKDKKREYVSRILDIGANELPRWWLDLPWYYGDDYTDNDVYNRVEQLPPKEHGDSSEFIRKNYNILYLAAYYLDIELVNKLIKAGAYPYGARKKDIEITSDNTNCVSWPLLRSCPKGNIASALIGVVVGLNHALGTPEERNRYGVLTDGPDDAVVFTGRIGDYYIQQAKQIIDILINNNVNINYYMKNDGQEGSALTYAFDKYDEGYGGNIEIIKYLINKGANFLTPSFDYWCEKLLYFAKIGEIDYVKILLDNGVYNEGCFTKYDEYYSKSQGLPHRLATFYALPPTGAVEVLEAAKQAAVGSLMRENKLTLPHVGHYVPGEAYPSIYHSVQGADKIVLRERLDTILDKMEFYTMYNIPLSPSPFVGYQNLIKSAMDEAKKSGICNFEGKYPSESSDCKLYQSATGSSVMYKCSTCDFTGTYNEVIQHQDICMEVRVYEGVTRWKDEDEPVEEEPGLGPVEESEPEEEPVVFTREEVYKPLAGVTTPIHSMSVQDQLWRFEGKLNEEKEGDVHSSQQRTKVNVLHTPQMPRGGGRINYYKRNTFKRKNNKKKKKTIKRSKNYKRS